MDRVARSAAFQKTWRLRELLLFLCDRALREPRGGLREQDIAEAVFGRGDDFDPIVDGLVRVQVTKLRKRLRLFFSEEGAAEPVVIDIPRGSYTPVFRPRDAAPDSETTVEEDDDIDAPEPRPRRGLDRRSLAVGAGAATLVLLAIAAILQGTGSSRRRDTGPSGEPRPNVERLWRQAFGNGRPVRLVLADASLTIFLDVTGRHLSASAYQRRDIAPQYGARAGREGPKPDPESAEMARQLLPQAFTSVMDADLAHRAGALLADAGAVSEVVRARDASPDTFRGANALVSGPRRSNPWTELFEGSLDFRSHYEPSGGGYFTNSAPRAGEPGQYRAVREQEGYCRVALLPNLDGTGNVLLLSGTDIPATQAGVDFVTRENHLAGLRQRLGLEGEAPFPRFEVMLRARLAAGAVASFEIAAHRTR